MKYEQRQSKNEEQRKYKHDKKKNTTEKGK